MRTVTLTLDCRVPDGIGDIELCEFLGQCIDIGLSDANDTLEDDDIDEDHREQLAMLVEADFGGVGTDDSERLHRIAFDVKKSFTLNKCTGKWHWFDRDMPNELSEPFDTHYAALCDAVAPYVEMD